MYVDRTVLQERLRRAVNGSQHIAICGDSGNGKTWLYQRYLRREKIPFKVVDLSIAKTNGVDHAFRDCLVDGYGWTPSMKKNSASRGIKNILEAQKNVEEQFTFDDVSPFDKLVTELSAGNSKPKFIVFDNMEQISQDGDILRHIASLVIRLDNQRFSLSGVRFLLVGVIADLKNLVSKHDNAGTVVNRITELPEVENLDLKETANLVRRGFARLRSHVDDQGKLETFVFHMTFGNPQQIHALCYQIACEAEKNEWLISDQQLENGFECWVDESISQQKAIVETRLNKKKTTVQRRNQVLYCLAETDDSEFSASEVEAMVKLHFPNSVGVNNVGCHQILSSLADGNNPLLAHMTQTGTFRFAHPKTKLAIRTLLRKSETGDVTKVKDVKGLVLQFGT